MKRYLCVLFLLLAFFSVYSAHKWMVMVYLCADNDLEPFSLSDVNEMESAMGELSAQDCEVIVLWDRAPGFHVSDPDWTGTKLYRVTADTDMDKINSTELADWGEKNMGDRQTVIEFGEYVGANYPAENYMMIFWDHGDGWYRDRKEKLVKAICTDDTSGDHLTTAELEYAMQELKNIFKKKIDIVGFDACLMQMAEVGYALKDSCDYMIASEQTEPGDGWSYDTALPHIAENTENPMLICRGFVQAYYDYYEGNAGWNVTLSAVRLSKYFEIITALRKFSQYAEKNMSKIFEEFRKAVNSVTYYDVNANVDMYNFFTIIHKNTEDLELKHLCEKVMMSVYPAVMYNKVTENNPIIPGSSLDVEHSYGIAFYMPWIRSVYDSSYESLHFAADTGWHRVIGKFFDYQEGVAGHNLNITISPSELRMFRARKNGDSWDYSEVNQSDFSYGYKCLVGHYPYGEYINDRYQLYMKFDFSSLDTKEIVISDARIYHRSRQTAFGKSEVCGSLKDSVDGSFITADKSMKIGGCTVNSESISGDGLTSHVQLWINGGIDNNGMVLGHDALNISGFIKEIRPENIYMTLQYHY